jgi:WD40 repeat protein
VWDVETFTLDTRLKVMLTFSASMQFLPDGQSLVIMDQAVPSALYVWDVETGYMTGIWREPIGSFSELKLDDPLTRFHWNYVTFDVSPDAALLATATATGTVTLWDTATLQQQTVQASTDDRPQFNIRKVVFSEDGQQLAYFDQTTGQTHVWDVASLTETAVYPVGGASFALSPDGTLLAWATRKELWVTSVDQPDAAEVILEFPEDYGAAPLLTLTFIADTNQLVVGGIGYVGEEDNPDNFVYVVTFGE